MKVWAIINLVLVSLSTIGALGMALFGFWPALIAVVFQTVQIVFIAYFLRTRKKEMPFEFNTALDNTQVLFTETVGKPMLYKLTAVVLTLPFLYILIQNATSLYETYNQLGNNQEPIMREAMDNLFYIVLRMFLILLAVTINFSVFNLVTAFRKVKVATEK